MPQHATFFPSYNKTASRGGYTVELDIRKLLRLRAMVGDLGEAGAKTAAERMQQIIWKNIGTQGPPRSRPGQPPHMESQQLYFSIIAEAGRSGNLREWRVRVDPNTLGRRDTAPKDYALMLEYGTAKMAARPFFLPAAQEAAQDIEGIADQCRSVLHEIVSGVF